MHILCLGINHESAELSLRERLSFSDDATRAALARIGCGDPDGCLKGELVILSTCNRVEIYATTTETCFSEMETFLSEARQVPPEEFQPYMYRLSDKQAVEHLLRVAAGLDSLVIGEPQILGQVIHALELARGQNAVGTVLSRLFQSAIHTGKRVRTETTIAHNPSSVSAMAVRLASETVRDLPRSHVVVLGAGETAELVVEALRKRGVTKITIINRTLSRAFELASRWGGEAATFESMGQILANADILVSSTGAPHPMVFPPMVSGAMESRPQRPLVMIDIAVPRDIDPEVALIPGVQVYDMDGLQERLAESLSSRQGQVPEAEAIIEDELNGFFQFLESLDVLHLIRNLRQQAEEIRRAELEKSLRRLPDLTTEERERINALTQALVNKILHSPTLRLRAEAGCTHLPEYAFVTRSLFSLNGTNGGTESHQECNFADGPCLHLAASPIEFNTYTIYKTKE